MKVARSCSCASLPMLRLATETVDYSYDIMSRSSLTVYRRADSDVKSIHHWDSQAYQTCYNSTLTICFTVKRTASKKKYCHENISSGNHIIINDRTNTSHF